MAGPACVFGKTRFVYVYGLSADCARLSDVHLGTTLRKEDTPTLALAQDRAEANAARLEEIYRDLGGSACAMPVREFLRRCYGLDLDRIEHARLRL